MKKIAIFLLAAGLFAFTSCEKDETRAILKSAPGAPTLTVPGGTDFVLQKADSAVMLTYTWTAADYGASVIPTYTLEMDKVGNNFGDPTAIGAVNTKTSMSIMTYDLNAKLLPLLFDPKNPEPLPMEFRVVTIVKDKDGAVIDTIKPVYSGVVAQNITPFYVPIVYPLLQVPGNYQGWNPADSSTAIASLKSNSKYEGYVYFADPNTEFKYTVGPSWDLNYGDDNADGTLEKNGANIKVTDAGYYKLNVDLVGLTHTNLKTTWALIGSATSGGWSTDTPMTYDVANKVWTFTGDLAGGEIKFRANGAWDLNYGDGGNNTLKEGGPNIAVAAAGNYTITMNLSNPVYKFKVTKN